MEVLGKGGTVLSRTVAEVIIRSVVRLYRQNGRTYGMSERREKGRKESKMVVWVPNSTA